MYNARANPLCRRRLNRRSQQCATAVAVPSKLSRPFSVFKQLNSRPTSSLHLFTYPTAPRLMALSQKCSLFDTNATERPFSCYVYTFILHRWLAHGRSSIRGRTPLMEAARLDQTRCCAVLAEAACAHATGLNAGNEAEGRNSALHYACSEGAGGRRCNCERACALPAVAF